MAKSRKKKLRVKPKPKSKSAAMKERSKLAAKKAKVSRRQKAVKKVHLAPLKAGQSRRSRVPRDKPAGRQSRRTAGFDAYLLKQTKKNHKYLVQTLKTRWRLSKSKNPKLKAKLARLIGRPVNPGEAGTSAQAFKSIDDRRARMRTEVMKEIMNQGTHGSTTYEIEQALDMLHQTASARVYELTGQGRIVDSGTRRKTGSGRNAIVHVQSLVPPPVGQGRTNAHAQEE